MVGFKFSYPGFLLGFSGGSYYQYKKLAPYVNQNWKLTTELWKVENILYVMNNLLVYEEKAEVDHWFYRVRQGTIEYNYIPNTPATTPTPSTTPSTTPSSTTTTAPPPTLAPLAPSYDEDYKVKEDTNSEDYILDYKVKEDANLDVKDDSKTKVATDEKIHADGVVYIEE